MLIWFDFLFEIVYPSDKAGKWLFFSDPASGRTSGNRGNIEKQVPRPSEEGHGARSGESDVGRCGQAACVVTAVYSSTAVGACPRTKQPQNHPECGGRGVCMSGACVA